MDTQNNWIDVYLKFIGQKLRKIGYSVEKIYLQKWEDGPNNNFLYKNPPVSPIWDLF